MKYWLLKSEPTSYSIDDLEKEGTTSWTGIRNYQARNYMKDMERGDMALFYHSSSKTKGVFGVSKVFKAAYPDPTQFNMKDGHYDPKATKTAPIWYSVDISFIKKFKKPVTLDEIKFRPEFQGMLVRNRGNRLSIMPVSEKHFKCVIGLS